MKYLAIVLIVCAMSLFPGYQPPIYAASGCGLCILEVQTQGINGEEDQDFVVIANLSGSTVTASSASPIRLQYYNDQGVAASSAVIATSTIPKDQVYVLVSNTLAEVNSKAQPLPMPLYSGGGSLQLYRGAAIYDKVGWGNAATAEGAAAPAAGAGMTLARKQVDGHVQDTNDNGQDFYLHELGCHGQEITEIQPFAIDAAGQSRDVWVEVKSGDDSAAACVLMSKAGDFYTLADADLARGALNVITHGTMPDGQRVPLHVGEVSGQVWLAAMSAFSSVALPATTRAYSNLENGQSYALVDGIWRRTYSVTPGEANVYMPTSTAQDDDPDACSTIRISELLPNPTGEDTSREWLEVTNESDQSASLKDCAISVGGVEYRFLPDDVLGAHEWRAVNDFYDEEQKSKSLSLRNTDTTLVILQRIRADGSAEMIQSFEYADAPEGQTWARFSDGWRWSVPTPNVDNALEISGDAPDVPTEFPAEQQGNSPQTDQSVATLPIRITELLPNPAAPGTDEADEFVELFNDGEEPVSLRGYKLQTGNSSNYSFTFTDQIVPPKSFMVVTSGNSSVSLANSGGRARLVASTGEVVSETMPYVDAPEGQSWAFIDGAWKWTASVTPGAMNVFKTPVVTALSKAKTQTSPKSTGMVKSAVKTNASTAKSPKTSPTASTKPTSSSDQRAVTVPSLHPLILAVVGGVGVLYAAYEYRQDIANKIYQFRRDRKNRRANRAPLEGRGAD